MKGDKLIYLPVHYKKVDYILNLISTTVTHSDTNLVICIAGESGTGKTEIARLLQESIYKTLDKTCKVIHVDDYYKTHWKKREYTRRKKGLNHVGSKEISWTKLNKVVTRFRDKDKQNIVKQIHMFTDTVEYTIVDCRNLDVLVIEGLYSLYTADYDVGIYLEGTRKDTYDFRKIRGKENPDNKFRKSILIKEAKDVQYSKQYADIFVPFNP